MSLLGSRQLSLLGGFCAFALLTPRVVHAHGDPPTARSVIVMDADGPVIVKLGQGLARRRGGGRFQFICPAQWGDQAVAPAAIAPPTVALDDGTVVIGAASGLMLMTSDGTIRPHPDPNARGLSTELARGEAGVFSLRLAQGQSEVLAIDAQAVRSLWRDSGSWYSLAALPHALVLVRANGTSVEQLSLSLEGAEIDRQHATVSAPVDYVFARAAGNDAYVLLLFQTTPTLGRIANGAFGSLAEGRSSIAGPLADGDKLLLAVDGQLGTLRDGSVAPLADQTYVTGLDRNAGQVFACTRDGVAHVADTGVGERVFSLSALIAPDSAAIGDEVARGRCDYQWQDFRFDLIALGMALQFEGPEALDAGVESASDAEAPAAPTPDAERVVDASTAREGEGLDSTARKAGSSCSLARAGQTGAWSLGWLFGLAFVLRRRRRT